MSGSHSKEKDVSISMADRWRHTNTGWLFRIISRHYYQAQRERNHEEVYSRQIFETCSLPTAPGCGHAIVNRLLAEVIDEMNLRDSIICVAHCRMPGLLYNYFDITTVLNPPGAAPLLATGIKRVRRITSLFPTRVMATLQQLALPKASTLRTGKNITIILLILVSANDRRTDGSHNNP